MAYALKLAGAAILLLFLGVLGIVIFGDICSRVRNRRRDRRRLRWAPLLRLEAGHEGQ